MYFSGNSFNDEKIATLYWWPPPTKAGGKNDGTIRQTLGWYKLLNILIFSMDFWWTHQVVPLKRVPCKTRFMAQKDPSKRPKQTPQWLIVILQIFEEKPVKKWQRNGQNLFFSFLGPKNGCFDGLFFVRLGGKLQWKISMGSFLGKDIGFCFYCTDDVYLLLTPIGANFICVYTGKAKKGAFFFI